MSTTYEIYKFAKPTLKELSIVDYYSDYDVFSILDEDGDSTGEFISLFRIDDKSVWKPLHRKCERPGTHCRLCSTHRYALAAVQAL